MDQPSIRRPRSENRRLREFVGVRLLPDEREAAQRLADARGLTLPGLIREALRAHLAQPAT